MDNPNGYKLIMGEIDQVCSFAIISTKKVLMSKVMLTFS